MGQYIDKNKVELEIKKHKLFAKDARNYAEENNDDIEIAVYEEVEDVCSSLLSFIDTLEVKEVQEPTASDRGMAEEIIVNLKRVEQDYHINLTKEIEWLRSKAQKLHER